MGGVVNTVGGAIKNPGSIVKDPFGFVKGISPGFNELEKANPFGAGPKLGSGGAFAMTPEAIAAEKEALARLRKQGSGKGPSITGQQFNIAMEQMARQRQSAAASARGVSNPALAMRSAQQAGEQANLELGQQAAMARLAEQQAANQTLLGAAASQRGTAASAAGAEIGARMDDAASRREMVGGGASGIASIAAAASDENQKQNKMESSDNSSKVISEFMDALKSYTYEYKKGAKQPGDKPNPEGEVSGVMAQDLEKSKLGKQMVTNTKNGKVVDFAQGMAPLFSAIAELNKKVKKLEK
jgi:hypothetical protein